MLSSATTLPPPETHPEARSAAEDGEDVAADQWVADAVETGVRGENGARLPQPSPLNKARRDNRSDKVDSKTRQA